MQLQTFFDELWRDFVKIAPQASAIATRLEELGETVANDHVAFRTFNLGPLALERLEKILHEQLGYSAFDEYRFERKKLRARAYRREGWPRIFLSELLVQQLDADSRAIVERCAQAVDASRVRDPAIFWSGRLWPALSYDEYDRLSQTSEYAGWLCALGLRPNHFTISINALQQLTSVEDVLGFVERAGYAINESSGRVKGSRAVLLEQGSTQADRVGVAFSDGAHVIPTCYYEFALRHHDASGRLYDGFVTDSADKIFESTHR